MKITKVGGGRGCGGLLPVVASCFLHFVRNVVQTHGVDGRIPEICMKRRTNTGDRRAITQDLYDKSYKGRGLKGDYPRFV